MRIDEVTLSAVLDDGELVYAFAHARGTPMRSTNDPSLPPSARGIHFCFVQDDGVWFDGKKVAFPKESRVFAVLPDGAVRAIELSAAEIDEFVARLERPDESAPPALGFKAKVLAPFATGN